MQRLTIDLAARQPPTREHSSPPSSLPPAVKSQIHPRANASTPTNSSIYFVGTATTIISYGGLRILTDPNFRHEGDHVHLGPGVVGTRLTNPAIDLHELPIIDLVLLSHYHADHFDEKVENSLRRDLPLVTTTHAKECLVDRKLPGEKFENVIAIEEWAECLVDLKASSSSTTNSLHSSPRRPAVKIRGIPGKHVPTGVLSTLNDLAGAVPPTNGYMVELGSMSGDEDARQNNDQDFENAYRIYISGDTLMVEELKEIPQRYSGQNIDLMLVHLGGTTIPSPKIPLLMVTMDAKQGLELIRLVNPDLTIPIHYDDYDVFLSPLDDFKKVIEEAGLTDRVVYLDRKDQFDFLVKDV